MIGITADEYLTELTGLHRELTAAAAAGSFRQAGRAFTRLLQVQAAHGALPGLDAYQEILDGLDRIPSRILGVRNG